MTQNDLKMLQPEFKLIKTVQCNYQTTISVVSLFSFQLQRFQIIRFKIPNYSRNRQRFVYKSELFRKFIQANFLMFETCFDMITT